MSQPAGSREDMPEASQPSRNTSNQADPLPRKIGELGFNPAIHGASSLTTVEAGTTTPLGPHPAERVGTTNEATPSSSSRVLPHHSRTNTSSTTSSESAVGQLATSAGQSSTSLVPSTSSMSSISRITKKLKPSPKPSKHLFGMAPQTLCKLQILILLFGAVCVGWALATKANAEGHGNPFGGGGGMNVVIFIHVAFSVIVLTLLLFIERTIFRLRAERFSYLHPESELPLRNPFSGGSHSGGLAFAPWQRPSLPSYAAALRAAPTTTGDVEDQEVARMVALGRGDVPPIYGNTRGSTLLAYGFGAGPSTNRPTSASLHRAASTGAPESRPVSYGHSQEIEDALRAQKLEETLTRLEAGK